MQLNSHNQIYKKRTFSTITTTLFSDIKSSITPPSTFCESILSDIFSIITHLTTFISQFQLLSRKNLKPETLITRTKSTIITELTSILNKIDSALNKSSISNLEIATQHTFTLCKPNIPLTSNLNPIDYQELLNENIIDRIKAKIINSYKTHTHLRNHNKSINHYYYNSTNNPLSNSTNIISPSKSTHTSKRNHKRGIRYYTVSRKHNGYLWDSKKMNTVNYSYNNKLLSFSMSRDKEDHSNNIFSLSNGNNLSMFHNSNNQTFVTFDDGKIYQTLAGSRLTITSKGGPKPSTYAKNLVNKGRNIIEDYRKKTGRKRSGSGNSYKLNIYMYIQYLVTFYK